MTIVVEDLSGSIVVRRTARVGGASGTTGARLLVPEAAADGCGAV
jgi:hypothetical protein